MTATGMDIEQLLLKTIAEKIGQTRFGMWFGAEPTLQKHDSHLVISAPNLFSAEWILGHFQKPIQEAAQEILGTVLPFQIFNLENGTALKSRSSSPVVSPVLVQNSSETPSFAGQTKKIKGVVTFSSVLASKELSPIARNEDFEEKWEKNRKHAPFLAKTVSEKSVPKLPVARKQILPSQTPLKTVFVPKTGVSDSEKPVSQTPSNVSSVSQSLLKQRNLQTSYSDNNPSQTLENFVEGVSNRLAVRAADLAARHPGKISPIYVYGPTSVGKTHLLEAVKNHARRNPLPKPPLYLTAEQFTTAFIEGIRQGMPIFRNKFRGISILLIDDIQFFEGKESTQTEFFRTIETLKKQGIQVFLTGNRSLAELTGILKPEIITRLEAGMQCEIQNPERETLLKIFQQMVVARRLTIPEDVCRFVVSRLTTHARQLSGALNRLHAVQLSTNQPITLQVAQEALDDLIRHNSRPIRLQDIEKAVCETFQIGSQTLQSKNRTKNISHPRMLAMWLARKYTRSALSEIGKYFGDRTHSTVVSAQKKVDQWVEENAEIETTDYCLSISEIVQKVERLLQSG